MLVKIEEIQEQGLTLTEPIKPAVLAEALTDSDDFSLVSSGPLTASFKKVSGKVHLTGAFDVTVTAPCKRCLLDTELTVPVAFSLRMVKEAPKPDEHELAAEAARAAALAADPNKRPKRKKQSAKQDEALDDELEGSIELDDIDAEPFDGKTIDLDPIVREQVLLALPLSVLHSDDCKGLCMVCGQDLNAKDCGHGGQKQIDPRLAKLAEFKLKN